MKKIWIGVGVFLISALLFKIWAAHGPRKKASPGKPAQSVLVGYRLPERKSFQSSLEFNASIQPVLQAEIRPKVSGWLRAVHAHTGDRVKKGDLLAEMDHVQQEEAVRQAEAELQSAGGSLRGAASAQASARAGAERQRLIVENDRKNLDRAKSLLDQGFVSQSQYDNVRTTYLSDRAQLEALEGQSLGSRAQLEAARAQLRRAQAALELARANLSDAYLVAPFAGVVTQRYLDPGAYISSALTSSLPILAVTDLRELKVMVNVTDRDLKHVFAGQEARLSVEAYPNLTFPGKVARVAGGLDPASRTLLLEVSVPNRKGLLLPGMFARISLYSRTRRRVLVLPLEALLPEEGKPQVWVVEKSPDGTRARKVPVTTGEVGDSWVEIASGLTGNEHVVTEGKELIHPGVPIQAVPAAESPVNSVKGR